MTNYVTHAKINTHQSGGLCILLEAQVGLSRRERDECEIRVNFFQSPDEVSGIFLSAYLRTLVEEGVDYKDKRNLTISSVVMVIGIGGGILQFTVGSDFVFSLGGVAFSTVVGIVLNLIIPKTVE